MLTRRLDPPADSPGPTLRLFRLDVLRWRLLHQRVGTPEPQLALRGGATCWTCTMGHPLRGSPIYGIYFDISYVYIYIHISCMVNKWNMIWFIISDIWISGVLLIFMVLPGVFGTIKKLSEGEIDPEPNDTSRNWRENVWCFTRKNGDVVVCC